MTKWMRNCTCGMSRVVYHTSKDCRMLKTEPIKCTERNIETLGLRECKVCAGTEDRTSGNGNRDYYNAALAND